MESAWWSQRTQPCDQLAGALGALLGRAGQRGGTVELLVRAAREVGVGNPLAEDAAPRDVGLGVVVVVVVEVVPERPGHRDIVVLDGRGAARPQRQRLVEQVGGPEEDRLGLVLARRGAQAVVAEVLAQRGGDRGEVAGEGELGDLDGVEGLGLASAFFFFPLSIQEYVV